MEKKYWEDKEYAYFSHKKCEYFPCHRGADPEDFNCLFCYCPLYALGDKCGGNFKYNEKGFKDCTNCQLPHKKDVYKRQVLPTVRLLLHAHSRYPVQEH